MQLLLATHNISNTFLIMLASGVYECQVLPKTLDLIILLLRPLLPSINLIAYMQPRRGAKNDLSTKMPPFYLSRSYLTCTVYNESSNCLKKTFHEMKVHSEYTDQTMIMRE